MDREFLHSIDRLVARSTESIHGRDDTVPCITGWTYMYIYRDYTDTRNNRQCGGPDKWCSVVRGCCIDKSMKRNQRQTWRVHPCTCVTFDTPHRHRETRSQLCPLLPLRDRLRLVLRHISASLLRPSRRRCPRRIRDYQLTTLCLVSHRLQTQSVCVGHTTSDPRLVTDYLPAVMLGFGVCLHVKAKFLSLASALMLRS